MATSDRVTGISFKSFSEAASEAFDKIPGDPSAEGLASAKIVAFSMEKGGIVGRVQFIVELEVTRTGSDAGAS